MFEEPERIWFRLRGYIDGASTLELALDSEEYLRGLLDDFDGRAAATPF